MAEILIYGDIGGWWDDGVTAKEVGDQLTAVGNSETTLDVRINSLGGSSADGLAIKNQLRSFSLKRKALNKSFQVRTIVDGYAYSAASIIVMAGDKIVMNTGSMLMIHNASLFLMGNAKELTEAASYLTKVDRSLAQVYADRSGKKLDDMLALMEAETFFDAQEAVAAGLADQIDESVTANTARYKDYNDVISSFQKTPGTYEKFMRNRASKSSSKGSLLAAARLRITELELDL